MPRVVKLALSCLLCLALFGLLVLAMQHFKRA